MRTAEVQAGYAEVNGARLYYEVAGSGPPVVLVHAGVADHRMWDPQLAAFAARYQVLRFDLRGYGRSTLPPGPFAMRDDLYTLLRQRDIASAHLVGCSLGGSIVLDFALEHPEMVRSLILVASGIGGRKASPELLARYKEWQKANEEGDANRSSELNVRLWVDGPRRGPEVVPAAIRDYVREANRIAYFEHDWRNATAQPLDPPAHTRLHEIQAPALLVVGDEDVPDVLESVDLLAAQLARAQQLVIPNAAHMVSMERPEAFNRAALDFLAAVEAS